ncbi:MAG: hypothetical protein ACOCX4_05540 [Planctomycetota bacterium]
MGAITKRVRVGPDHRIRIEVQLPSDFPEGEVDATVEFSPAPSRDATRNRLAELAGKGRGRFWMADDFDAPLDDFADLR